MGVEGQKGEVTIYANPLGWGKDNSTDFPLLLALVRHSVNIGAVGKDVINERGEDSRGDAKQTGSEQSGPYVAQVLVEFERGVEDVEHRQRVLVLEACAA